MTKSAFVAIVGKPNVGKSSLLNLLVGEKIAIISDKPQTTRTRITGVLTEEETQLVFIDTPGLQKQNKGRVGEQVGRRRHCSAQFFYRLYKGVDNPVFLCQNGKQTVIVAENFLLDDQSVGCHLHRFRFLPEHFLRRRGSLRSNLNNPESFRFAQNSSMQSNPTAAVGKMVSSNIPP